VHALAAGLDSLLFPDLVESPHPLTNSRGVFAPSLGEFCVAGMLWFAKDLRRMLRQQEAVHWEPFDVGMIEGATLGIVGYGSIGREAAKRARAFGMRVLAVRTRPEPDPFAHSVYSTAEMNSVIERSDYLLVSAPLTPETHHLIGEEQLALLPPDSVVINLGRGPVIDEAALARFLEQKRLRGAVLDVFETEPLPPSSPFWKLENVLLSPHCADHTPGWLESAVDLFVENFGRFLRGAPLENVVDKKRGY
jgi:phosphoglycerate dehydrogenase-like enzyme